MRRGQRAATLARLTSWHAIRESVASGAVVRDGRGRYALPGTEEAVRAASRLSGVVSLTSAAAWWGWELKAPTPVPTVTIDRSRKVAASRTAGVRVLCRDLSLVEVHAGRVTAPVQTVLDCGSLLPFDEALAVADSALRHGDVSAWGLRQAAAAVRGPGAVASRRVAAEASPLAANPFESVLRAISLDVPGLRLRPQVWIVDGRFGVRSDLVDEERRVVVEADSYEHHGSRRALVADCARYDNLVARGWTVLRFAWEQVMSRPEWVKGCLEAVVATKRPAPRSPSRRKEAR